MKLAWKYIQFYRWRSIVFVAILSVVMALPFISQALTGYLVENIDRRTDSSPIIVSSRAGKIRQTLSTLFFLGSEESTTFKYDVFDEIAEKEGEARGAFASRAVCRPVTLAMTCTWPTSDLFARAASAAVPESTSR